MEIEILKNSKQEMEVQLESLTLAELLKVYLNKDPSVTFAAWKREHPTKKPILSFSTKGKTAKKALNDAINSIVKELDRTLSDVKTLK